MAPGRFFMLESDDGGEDEFETCDSESVVGKGPIPSESPSGVSFYGSLSLPKPAATVSPVLDEHVPLLGHSFLRLAQAPLPPQTAGLSGFCPMPPPQAGER